MKLLTTTAALLIASGVAAQDKPLAPPPAGDVAVPAAPAPSTDPAAPPAGAALAEPAPSSVFYDGTKFGFQIDAGAPAGASAALVYRPWSYLRLNAGVAYDAVAFGVKGGVTLIPFHWGVVPTLSLEAGHFAQGNVTDVVTITDPVAKELLTNVGFDYASADLGVEFGSQNRFVFYIRAGIAQVWAHVNNLNGALQKVNTGRNTTYHATDPKVDARVPSARIGFIFYLF